MLQKGAREQNIQHKDVESKKVQRLTGEQYKQ